MVNIIGTTIELTRGDTLRVYLSLREKESGDEYTPKDEDTLRFAAKKQYTDPKPIIEKNIPTDTMLLQLAPNDTKKMPFGDYVYDIQLTHANGDVDTFIDRAVFRITEEVD